MWPIFLRDLHRFKGVKSLTKTMTNNLVTLCINGYEVILGK